MSLTDPCAIASAVVHVMTTQVNGYITSVGSGPSPPHLTFWDWSPWALDMSLSGAIHQGLAAHFTVQQRKKEGMVWEAHKDGNKKYLDSRAP